MRGKTAIRVLLSDYLVDALATTLNDLREIALSLEDFRRVTKDIEARSRRQLRKTNGSDPVPPPTAAAQREQTRRDATLTGFFRAAGSVMDNLGVALVVIGGFHIEVVEQLTWAKALRQIAKEMGDGSASPDQSQLAASADQAVADAGVDGWLTWTTAMRNMLVHRARRLWMSHLVTRRDPKGRIVSVQHDLYLPLEPSLTDVEVMRQGNSLASAVLLEPAQDTMAGVLDSLRSTAEDIAAALTVVYDARIADPSLIDQPAIQWRKTIILDRHGPLFRGYHPLTVDPEDITGLLTGPDMVQRMSAAAVQDDRRTRWPDWLAEATPAPPQAQPSRNANGPSRRKRRRDAKTEQEAARPHHSKDRTTRLTQSSEDPSSGGTPVGLSVATWGDETPP